MELNAEVSIMKNRSAYEIANEFLAMFVLWDGLPASHLIHFFFCELDLVQEGLLPRSLADVLWNHCCKIVNIGGFIVLR